MAVKRSETTRYSAGNPDAYSINLAGKQSLFIEKDHLLLVSFVIISDNFQRVFYDRIASIASFDRKCFSWLIVSLIVAFFPGIIGIVMAIGGFRTDSVGFQLTGFGLMIVAVAIVLLGLFLMTRGETKFIVTTHDGKSVDFVAIGSAHHRDELRYKLLEAVRTFRSENAHLFETPEPPGSAEEKAPDEDDSLVEQPPY
ncbi:MAG: hypothetical protein Kow00107_08550 [Planctomycetota bacterium]